jgi:hypothetical protein
MDIAEIVLKVVFFLYFQVSNYEKELEDMKHMTRQEFVASLRRSV